MNYGYPRQVVANADASHEGADQTGGPQQTLRSYDNMAPDCGVLAPLRRSAMRAKLVPSSNDAAALGSIVSRVWTKSSLAEVSRVYR